METKITSPMTNDLIDNIRKDGSDIALINCDECKYNKSCDLYNQGVRRVTKCNSYTIEL